MLEYEELFYVNTDLNHTVKIGDLLYPLDEAQRQYEFCVKPDNNYADMLRTTGVTPKIISSGKEAICVYVVFQSCEHGCSDYSDIFITKEAAEAKLIEYRDKYYGSQWAISKDILLDTIREKQ